MSGMHQSHRVVNIPGSQRHTQSVNTHAISPHCKELLFTFSTSPAQFIQTSIQIQTPFKFKPQQVPAEFTTSSTLVLPMARFPDVSAYVPQLSPHAALWLEVANNKQQQPPAEGLLKKHWQLPPQRLQTLQQKDRQLHFLRLHTLQTLQKP